MLGVWPDGSAALTRRALGRGFVYCFADTLYPGELIAGLTEAQGLATYASAEGGFDLLRTLRSNNGTEDLLMVRGKGGKEATIRWTLEYPPERIYDPVTGRTIPAQIEGRTATVTLKLDDWDFLWLAARLPVAPNTSPTGSSGRRRCGAGWCSAPRRPMPNPTGTSI